MPIRSDEGAIWKAGKGVDAMAGLTGIGGYSNPYQWFTSSAQENDQDDPLSVQGSQTKTIKKDPNADGTTETYEIGGVDYPTDLGDLIRSAISTVLEQADGTSDDTTDLKQAIHDAASQVLKDHGLAPEQFRGGSYNIYFGEGDGTDSGNPVGQWAGQVDAQTGQLLTQILSPDPNSSQTGLLFDSNSSVS